ncbi:MAG: DNA (cytosine-5-)-methyltransferase [Cytophagales bacterium CG12_big_fil_rev_8_21_14_0_65_40_12]|nr:MAG: DNA (cytosine-5-)-methyltransferase [Cytophagales bacterium CG12_big_fil_rev_8_21_14_0_65_40_12]PIW04444.1 MAG: DNA (cytosine-5-)-methyltransferase [Cytophagales bacterium CG17_big_fil_post_rev_8_21_14_2_50_40_13]
MENNTVKFIDLFAGLGGIRLGFEQAFESQGIKAECVMTSEIKPYAVKTLHHNFPHDYLAGDIFTISNDVIPDFDFLLGGFPCQPFSAGGKRQGFLDTRGTLFFEIERIIREKRPYGFILENVEGLVKHDLANKNDKIGRTLQTILNTLKNDLGYSVSWKVFDSIEFGLPQSRKRIFIVGTLVGEVNLDGHEPEFATLSTVLEKGLRTIESDFTKKLFSKFELDDLLGMSIKDKRGGDKNIHSWDIGLKGEISESQNILLNQIFKQRRKKGWADEIGIDWMDGMPLTLDQVSRFSDLSKKELFAMLEDLTTKGYLRLEHPKKLVKEFTTNGIRTFRSFDETKPKGYNIITGKLSFEINKILDPKDIAPTIVATDVSRLAVPDGNGLRRLTIREGLRLFGFPEWYEIPTKTYDAFDLLGNTVAVPVVRFVAEKLAFNYASQKSDHFIFSKIPV